MPSYEQAIFQSRSLEVLHDEQARANATPASCAAGERPATPNRSASVPP